MIEYIIISIILGILIGTLTGLAPGIHINLVAAMILSLPLEKEYTLPISTFIASLAITHTCIDFIPSIYLGAPEEDTYLSILPGHTLLLEGKGHEAAIIAMLGVLSGTILGILSLPILLFILPKISEISSVIIPYILITVLVYMTLREEKKTKVILAIFLSASLGLLTFNLPVKDPLMPLLTGLFGLSSLLLSTNSSVKIPKQKSPSLKQIELPKKEAIIVTLSTLVLTPIFSYLPALGSGYAALVSSEIKNYSKRGFIFLIGTLNASLMVSSFITLYSINRARTGAAAAIDQLMTLNITSLGIILLTIIISVSFAFLIGKKISPLASRLVEKVNYRYLSLIVSIILLVLNIIFSNLLGILVLFTATCIGIYAAQNNIKKTHLMSALIIPTITYYLL